jgi:cytochrome bd-type quinol oxidase subunit 2
MRYAGLALAVGVVALGAYLVINATSKPTEQTSSACAGDWTDYINPACIIGGVTSTASNAANMAANELNTILIILAVVAVAVVGLLAFGPQTGHIARGAGALAVL